ncbi:MAG: hypothetical protein L6265_10805 [Thermoplasmatales archaeon]|nr:hypothetical protein [Thermoplasmatales archaeon]
MKDVEKMKERYVLIGWSVEGTDIISATTLQEFGTIQELMDARKTKSCCGDSRLFKCRCDIGTMFTEG